MKIKDLQLDVALVAGPRLDFWPSPGVAIVSEICTRFGLKVGWIGGADLRARGVLPLPGTGGLIFCEDTQERIYRVQSRAIVRWVPKDDLPDPFPGSGGAGLLPGATAMRLAERHAINFGKSVALIGTDNRAFRFGSQLLERGCHEVYIVEPLASWGGKRYAGWEVEKRRFEILGGKVIEATPVELKLQRPMLWEFRIEDARGIRVLEVNRVVSFGPFQSRHIFQEFPPGSSLYRFEQLALNQLEKDSSGWMREEEAAHYLASRLVKSLVTEVKEGKEDLEFIARRSRSRLHRMETYLEEPHSFEFQGKWLTNASLRAVKSFSGVPQVPTAERECASIECFETIGCNICEVACPEQAITFDRLRARKPEESRPIIDPAKCTACGVCLVACPSSTPVLLKERENQSLSSVGIGLKEGESYAAGETVTMLNRRGEALGSSRILQVTDFDHEGRKRRVARVEVPTHLLWEVRGLRKPSAHASAIDPEFLEYERRELAAEKKVELTLDGERRVVRERLTVQETLFESGINRPGDLLNCPDGSCGLCELEIDGVKQLSCRTLVRKGMVIRTAPTESVAESTDRMLCPCMSVTTEEVETRIREGKIQTPEAALQATGVGQGRCHGLLCMEPGKRCLERSGIELKGFTSWKFPWTDWTVDPGSVE